ncbi:conserved hypothetical protein [Culex quinquefasciatus]|uniref:Uncharacterized protein n=1 Tax=Culex quinquefasciatus TaxID=7176 RepID=B0XK76_CULQU|nr:conserved hypothetical protein [Culex quinquefasciatus]|eukprot:XP_001870048.1 conserved hypothetical protein [Culex quinquefasciatus]
MATPEGDTGYRWPLGDTLEFARNHVIGTIVRWPNLATPEQVTGNRWPFKDISEFARNHVK